MFSSYICYIFRRINIGYEVFMIMRLEFINRVKENDVLGRNIFPKMDKFYLNLVLS